jgi:protease-4
MGSDTLSDALTDAAEDDKVKAIIFRVNSPGGSAIASDQIWDAVNRAKESGKPVIISMGQYAASGGYYVAANADKIVAMPTTLTGSIGVYGGKIALGELHDKLGYNVAAISKGGEYTAAYASGESWTPELREKYRRSMEDIYTDFTGRVAEGRDLPIERVREIAKGRVWTGTQAKEIGLVDELGGFMRAIEIAKAEADIDADTKVRLKTFPKPLSTSEQIEQLLSGSVSAGGDLAALTELLSTPQAQALLAASKAANTSAEDRSLMADMPVIK